MSNRNKKDDSGEVAFSGIFVLAFVLALVSFVVSTGHADDWSKPSMERGAE
jgi:hypothetical protein